MRLFTLGDELNDNNRLTASDLTSLKQLYMQKKPITTLPTSLLSLKNLEHLHVSHNNGLDQAALEIVTKLRNNGVEVIV